LRRDKLKANSKDNTEYARLCPDSGAFSGWRLLISFVLICAFYPRKKKNNLNQKNSCDWTSFNLKNGQTKANEKWISRYVEP
jgi:hypothetical protein